VVDIGEGDGGGFGGKMKGVGWIMVLHMINHAIFHGIWVTWGMGYGVLRMYGLLTGFPCIPSW